MTIAHLRLIASGCDDSRSLAAAMGDSPRQFAAAMTWLYARGYITDGHRRGGQVVLLLTDDGRKALKKAGK
jgi:CTP-dependent riboflavin kinase